MPEALPCRVLVVEDEALIAKRHEDTLHRAGCSVVSVSTGEQAIEIACVTPLQLAGLDLGLPGSLDGTALIAALRAMVPVLPVVVVTDYWLTASEKRELDDAGGGPPVAVLPKPHKPAELVAEVLARLSKAQPARA